ncbi:MAG: hypothetical protein U0903_00970 [Planctomycetales bacterium]
MASSTKDQSSGLPEQYADFDEYIDFRLHKTQTGVKGTDLLTSSTALLAMSLAYLLVFVLCDQWLFPQGFSLAARWVLLLGLIGLVGTWLTLKILVPSMKSVNALFVARMIESADPELKNNLLTLVDLQQAERPISPTIRRSMEKRAALKLTQLDSEQVIDHRPLVRSGSILLAIVTICCGYLLLSPKNPLVSVERLLLPGLGTPVATQTSISQVQPGDAQVAARSIVDVRVELKGKPPANVRLFYTTDDKKYVEQPVEMQREDSEFQRYTAQLAGDQGRGLLQSLTYFVTAGDARTRNYRVTVSQPPSAKVESIRLEFPRYMKLPPQEQSEGNINTWDGAKAKLRAVTNIPVQSAQLVRSDQSGGQGRIEAVALNVEKGTVLTGEFPLEIRSDGNYFRYYHIECMTADRQSDPEPTEYTVKLRPDQAPEVTLVHPTGDLERPANAMIPLLIKARDPDFGLRYLTLRAEQNGKEVFQDQIFEGNQPRYEGRYVWSLRKVKLGHLQPGDEMHFWIEAGDTHQPLANRKNTPRLMVKITAPVEDRQAVQQRKQDEAQQDKLQAEARKEGGEENGTPEGENGTPDEPQTGGSGDQKREEGTPNAAEENNVENRAAQGREPADREENPERSPEGNRTSDAQQKTPPEKNAEQQKQPAEQQQPQPGGESQESKPQQGNRSPQQPPKADDQQALQRLLDRQEQQQRSQQSGNSSKGEDGKKGSQQGGGKSQEQGGGKNQETAGSSPDNSASDDQKPNDRMKPTDSSTMKENKSQQAGSPGKTTEKTRSDQNPQGKEQNPPDTKSESPEKMTGDPQKGDSPKNQQGTAKDSSKNTGASKQNPETSKTPNKSTEETAKKKQAETESPDAKGMDNKPSQNPGEKKSDPSQGKSSTKNSGGKNSNSPNSKPQDGHPQGDKSQVEKEEAEKSKSDPETSPADKTQQGTKPDQKETGEKNPKQGAEKQGAKFPDGKNSKSQPQQGSKQNATEQAGESPEKPSEQQGAPDGKESQGGKDNPDSKAMKDPGAAKQKDPAQKDAAKQDAAKNKAAQKDPDQKNKSPDGKSAAEKKAADNPSVKKEAGDQKPEQTGGETPPKSMPEKQPNNPPVKDPKNKTVEELPPTNPKNPPMPKEPEEPMSPMPSDVEFKSKSPQQDPTQSPKAGTGQKNKGTPSAEKKPPKDEKQQESDKPDDKSGEPGKPGQPKEGEKPGKSPPEGGGGAKPKADAQKPKGAEAKPPMKDEGSPMGPSEEGGAAQPGGEPKGAKSETKGPGTDKPGEGGGESEKGRPAPGEGQAKQKQTPGNSKSDPKSNPTGGPQAEKPQSQKPEKEEAEKPDPQNPDQPQGDTSPQGSKGGGKDSKNTKDAKEGPQHTQNGGGGGEGQGNQAGSGSDATTPDGTPDPVKLEHAKEATNLVLKKLKNDMDRGKIDQQLLKDLGWTEDDLKQFVSRMEKELQEYEDVQDPKAEQRRRQFTATLDALKLEGNSEKRKSASTRVTRNNEGARNVQIPAEYREVYQSYTKSLSKRRGTTTDKKTPAKSEEK